MSKRLVANLVSRIPGSLGLAELVVQARGAGRAQRVQSEMDQMPRFALSDRHVEGCEVLLDREALLRRMPTGCAVAELGVDQGDFSARILEITKPSRLYLIDAWDTERYGQAKADAVAARFGEAISAGQVEILRGYSTDQLAHVDDGALGWIYVDTDHSYATTRSELQLASRKVRAGGYIAGHDYVTGNFPMGFKYGVKEAVAEFCAENEWRLAFWTADFSEYNSFAIQKF